MSVARHEAPAARFSEAFLLLTNDREGLVELLEVHDQTKSDLPKPILALSTNLDRAAGIPKPNHS